MKTYIVSDTHLNHDNIATYCDRPPNFTELIDRNVKQIVKPEDLVIHVGDIGVGKSEGYMDMVAQWPGRWILVRGNHDGKSCQWYMEHGFDFACDAMIYRGVWITHKPSDILPAGCSVNLHGHLHNVWDGFCDNDPERENDIFSQCSKSGRLPQPWHRLFAIEYTNYMPVDFDKFIAKPDKYQSRGPNAETRERMRLKREASKMLESAVNTLIGEGIDTFIGEGNVAPETPNWDKDRGDGFNSRGYDAGLGIYHDPMGD